MTSTEVRSINESTTNDELVRMVLNGDRDAESELFARHHGFMRGIASVANLPVYEWDDCIQTSWERAMRSIDRLREIRAFKSWLATIARNEAVTMHRRRNREQPSVATELDQMVEIDLDHNMIASDQRRALITALGTLDAADRHLIDLLFVQRQPYRTVAAEIGCRIGSIGPTRGRVLNRLKAAYLREIGDGVDGPMDVTARTAMTLAA